jgi:hypothetical protein
MEKSAKCEFSIRRVVIRENHLTDDELRSWSNHRYCHVGLGQMDFSFYVLNTYNMLSWHWRLHHERTAESRIISTGNYDFVFEMRPNNVIVLYR